MCTTVPGKPASATTRFEPPARTSSGSPAARHGGDDRGLVGGLDERAGGPPRRSVVRSARAGITRPGYEVGEMTSSSGNVSEYSERRMFTRRVAV